MHYFRTLFVALTALSLASCTGSKPQPTTQSADTVTDVEGVSVRTMADGSVVTWIQDNEGDRLNSPDLFADAPRELIDSLGLTEGIASSVSTFLLQTDGKTILFDAGLGPQKGGHMLQRLASIGITPDSIDMIYLTHLHLDHIGGMMGDEGPVFPQAQVYLSQREYDAWLNEMPQDRTELQRQLFTMYS